MLLYKRQGKGHEKSLAQGPTSSLRVQDPAVLTVQGAGELGARMKGDLGVSEHG